MSNSYYRVWIEFQTQGTTCQTPTGSIRTINSDQFKLYITNFDYKDWPKGTKIYADITFILESSRVRKLSRKDFNQAICSHFILWT